MVERVAEAEWGGTLQDGNGLIKLGSGAFQGAYSFGSRFANERGTNPEELLGAAHAGCFSMALALMLGEVGFTPRRIHTTAKVAIEKKGAGFQITHVQLETAAAVPGISAETFQARAELAKRDCPISLALANTPISLTARLVET